MFNSVALDVVIGLVFIYLLYSLLATIIQELIATHLGLRSKTLKKGIKRMLDDTSKNTALSDSFYNHPLIKYLGSETLHKNPSYLSAKNFSKVLIDLLRGEKVTPGEDFRPLIQDALNGANTQWITKTKISPETLLYLKSLWADAQGDVTKFKSLLEGWFDDTMERASGWYKKRTQLILFFIGITLAVAFNIDTIAIAQKLSADPKLAAQLADNATAYMKTHKELGDQLRANAATQSARLNQKDTTGVTQQQLDSISKYVVVQSNVLMDSANALIQGDIHNTNELMGLGLKHPGNIQAFITENFHWRSMAGWLLTALAISLGAPFWFDLLNKFVQLRGAGKKPEDPEPAAATNTATPVKRVG